MKAIAAARDRRLSASVAEAVHGVDEALVRRVAARLRAEAQAPRRSRRALWAAALLLFGAGIAAAVGHLVHARDRASAAQDPQPAALPKVTTAGCTTATITKSMLEVEAHEALVGLAREVDVPIVIASAVRGKVTLEAEQKPWREVLEQAAGMVGGSVQEYGSVILVTARPAKSGTRVKLRTPRMPLPSFVLTIASAANANVVIASDVDGDLDVDLDQVPWRAALDGAAAALGAEVVGTGDVLVVRKRVPEQRSRVSINFTRLGVDEVLDRLAQINRWNVVIAPAVKGGVTVQTFRKEVVVMDVLRAITAAVAAQLSELRPVMHIEPVSERTATPLLLRGEAMDVHQLRELTKARTGWDVTVADKPEAKLWLFAPTARVDDLWRAVALATGRHLVGDGKGSRLE